MFKWYEEAKSIAERDPAARSVWQVFWQYPGYKALRLHRRAHWFEKGDFILLPVPFLSTRDIRRALRYTLEPRLANACL